MNQHDQVGEQLVDHAQLAALDVGCLMPDPGYFDRLGSSACCGREAGSWYQLACES